MSALAAARPSAAKAWARALALTAPITSRPTRTLPVVIDELAERDGEAPALLSEYEWLTVSGLARHARRYARWAGGEEGVYSGRGRTPAIPADRRSARRP